MTMPLRGMLRSSPLSDILQLLNNARKTGILRVYDEEDTKLLVFHQGQLTYVVHQRPFPRLSDLVVHRGLARESDVSDSYEERHRWDDVVSRTRARRSFDSGRIPLSGDRRSSSRLVEKDRIGRLRSLLLAQRRLTDEQLDAATTPEAIPDILLEGMLRGTGLLRPVEIHDAKPKAGQDRTLLQCVLEQGLLGENDIRDAVSSMSDETLAELLIYQGHLGRSEARRFLSQLEALRSQAVPRIRLGEYLVTKGKVTQRQLERALEEQLVRNERLGQILAENGIISAEEVTKANDEIVSLREDFGPLYALRRKLAERHSVSDEEFSEALNESRQAGVTLVEALEATGKVTAEETKSAVRRVILDEICDLLTWKDAAFEFFDDLTLADLFESHGFPSVQVDLGQDTEMPVVSLLLRAHSILDEEHYAGLEQFSLSTVLVAVESAPADDAQGRASHRRRVTRQESDRRLTHRNVLRSLQGRRSLREIRRVLPGNRSSHMRLFAELMADGLVRPLTRCEAFENGKKALSRHRSSEALVLFQHALEAPGDDPSNSRLRALINDARWSIDRHLLRRIAFSLRNVVSAIAESAAVTRASECLHQSEKFVAFKNWLGRGRSFLRERRQALERYHLILVEFMIRSGWARHLWTLRTHTVDPIKHFLEQYTLLRLACGFAVCYLALQSCLSVFWPGDNASPPIASAHTTSSTAVPLTRYASPIHYRTGGPIDVPATVHDAQIYVAARDGKLRAVGMGPESGAAQESSARPFDLLWDLEVGEYGDLLSTPIVAGEHVFLTNVRGRVYAISLNGEMQWERRLPRCECIAPTPLFDEESTLAGITVVSRQYVYILAAEDGRTLYRIQTGDQVVVRPVVDGGTLTVGSGDDHIYQVAWRDGRHLWEHDASDEIMGLVRTGHAVIFTTRDGRLAALDGGSGTLLWTRVFPRHAIRRIESSEPDMLWVETSRGELSSVSAASGETVATVVVDPDLGISRVHTHKDQVYYSAQDGSLGAIDSQGGLIWRTKGRVGQVTGWAHGKQFLVVTVHEGSLAAFPLESAEERPPSEP